MMQGDSYNIMFQIKNERASLDISQVNKIEFSIGKIRKYYPSEVTYNNGIFLFPITQNETFSLSKLVRAQARIKFNNGQIEGVDFGEIEVLESISKAVI